MISANKWVTRAMTCEVTGRKLRSHCDYPLVAHLTVADLICIYPSSPVSIWKTERRLCLQLHHVALIFDSDCFICHCQCNPPKQKTNPSARLGNEGHINMCCANSCAGRGEATLQGGEVPPPSRSTVTRLEGASRWKSKTQPDHRGCEGRVGSPLWTMWRQGKLGRRSPGTCFYQARTSCCQGLVPHGPAL